MLIARQNGHIDQAPWMKKPAGPIKARKSKEKRKQTPDPKLWQLPNPRQTHTVPLILFNDAGDTHKGR